MWKFWRKNRQYTKYPSPSHPLIHTAMHCMIHDFQIENSGKQMWQWKMNYLFCFFFWTVFSISMAPWKSQRLWFWILIFICRCWCDVNVEVWFYNISSNTIVLPPGSSRLAPTLSRINKCCVRRKAPMVRLVESIDRGPEVGPTKMWSFWDGGKWVCFETWE